MVIIEYNFYFFLENSSEFCSLNSLFAHCLSLSRTLFEFGALNSLFAYSAKFCE